MINTFLLIFEVSIVIELSKQELGLRELEQVVVVVFVQEKQANKTAKKKPILSNFYYLSFMKRFR